MLVPYFALAAAIAAATLSGEARGRLAVSHNPELYTSIPFIVLAAIGYLAWDWR